MSLTTNLVSYYKFDEASGNAADSTANANTLTNVGTVTYSAGKINNGASLNGTTQYFDITDSTSLRITGDLSVFAWVKFNTANTASYVLSKGFESDNNITRAYNFGFSADNKLNFFVSSAGSGGGQAQVAWTPSTGTWYYIGAIYTASAGSVSFYVNGSQQGSTITGLQTSIYSSASKTFVGSYDQTYYYFKGLLDELGIWSRVLTSTEVTSLYNGGAGLQYPFSTFTPNTSNFFAFF